MRAGARPFGCALLVGCLGEGERDYDAKEGCMGPTMYRVDPSGAVESLTSFNEKSTLDLRRVFFKGTLIEGGGRKGSVAFLGNWDPLGQKKYDIQNQLENQQFTNEEQVQDILVDLARQTFADKMSSSKERLSEPLREGINQTVLFASFTHERGLQISRITT